MLRTRRLLLMPYPRGRQALGALLASALLAGSAAAGPLRVSGSTTVNPVVAEAAAILRAERGMTIHVDTLGGSSGGIAALGDGRAEIAMSSRPLLPEDRARYPGVAFRPVAIGTDAVALVVSRDVWEGGVRALSAQQVRGIYEGRIRSWREVGGSHRRIVFFNKEPGRGTWEVFVRWLYGEADRSPLVSHPEVGSNEEARAKVASTPGAISQLSAAWADGEAVFALALRTAAGEVEPSAERIADGSYPLSRPLLVVTDGEPGAEERALLAFLLAPRGQEIVRRHGYLPLLPGARGGASP